jgi:ParB family chromosome partitioning protein
MSEIKRLRDIANGRTDLFKIDPRTIVIEEDHNPRNYNLTENRAHLDALKSSIREMGVLNPITVRFDAGTKSAILVDGECRLRACLELIAENVGIESIPAIGAVINNEKDRLFTAIIANTGKPLSKWELGSAFSKLIKYGATEQSIASKTGYSQRFVTEAITLDTASDEIKELLSQQAVTPSLVVATIKAKGIAATQEIKEKVQAARDSGQTNPLKRERTAPDSAFAKAVEKLMKSFSPDEIDEAIKGEFQYVSVPLDVILEMRQLIEGR